jgi:hypothetical protein
MGSYKARAKAVGVPYNLTKEHLREVWDSQGGRCFYSGVPIDFTNVVAGNTHPHKHTPSLDRKEPALGYVIGNVVWASQEVNRLKGNLTPDELLALCSKIVGHHYAITL